MTAQGEGWFADPQDAARLRWWDGTRWTEHTRGRALPRPPLERGWPVLAVALQVSLAATVAMGAFVVLANRTILDVWQRLALDPASVPLDEADRADLLSLLSLGELPLMLVTGVLFIVWLHTAHRSSATDPTQHRRRSGWAIGGWFVPFVNLWFPFQCVGDLRRGARGDVRLPSWWLLGGWWAAFVVGTVANRGVGRLYAAADDVPDDDLAGYADALARATRVEAVAEGVLAVAAVLAILVVQGLTRTLLAAPAPVQPAAAQPAPARSAPVPPVPVTPVPVTPVPVAPARQAPGWYVDPQDSRGLRLRWWDGLAWTEHTHTGAPERFRPGR